MDLFRQTIQPVEKALNDAKMDKGKIHDVVLVGGSIRIPKIQKMLQVKENCVGLEVFCFTSKPSNASVRNFRRKMSRGVSLLWKCVNRRIRNITYFFR